MMDNIRYKKLSFFEFNQPVYQRYFAAFPLHRILITFVATDFAFEPRDRSKS